MDSLRLRRRFRICSPGGTPNGLHKIIDATKKRSETYIAVYFSQEEKDKILELASEKGLSASSFIRSILKEQKLI